MVHVFLITEFHNSVADINSLNLISQNIITDKVVRVLVLKQHCSYMELHRVTSEDEVLVNLNDKFPMYAALVLQKLVAFYWTTSSTTLPLLDQHPMRSIIASQSSHKDNRDFFNSVWATITAAEISNWPVGMICYFISTLSNSMLNAKRAQS